MDITYLPELIPFLKHKHLLLDTNVFRDISSKPKVFTTFFNELKQAEVTLTTIDMVKYELLKGSSNNVKYKEKEILINEIIDIMVPILPKTYECVYEVIKLYGLDGTALNITDLFLGGITMQYGESICLMTRDTTDFIQRIFDLCYVVNVPNSKGIFTYGIYQYKK